MSRFVLMAFAVALLASGCGRRGDLEPPGTVEQPKAAQPTVIGALRASRPPVETPPPDKPFVLDGII